MLPPEAVTRHVGLLWALVALLGCTAGEGSAHDAGADAGSDLGAAVDVPPTAPEDAGPPPPRWPRTLPPAAEMAPAETSGRWLRTIVHAHSVHSHDACDGEPYVDGGPNEPCLQSFRRALCDTRVDLVFLTEHADRIATVPFETVMQQRPGDEPILEDGALVGYRIACASGHRVMILPGAENELMPLGLRHHPAPRDGSLDRAYHHDGPEGARRFREAGALVAVAHCEQRPRAELEAIAPDVIELYNIHANLDPRIAGAVLNLDLGAVLSDAIAFSQPARRLDPEWMFLAIFRENHLDLAHWAAFAAQGRRVAAVAASDAHENSFPGIFPDGERGDSYRRIFRWFSNALYVSGPVTRASVMAALAEGRSHAVFEAYGTPVGFAFTARTGGPEGGGATVHRAGDTVSLRGGVTLRVAVPTVYQLDPALPRPAVRVRLLRAETDGRWTELAAGPDALAYTVTTAGAYRAEALITPHHAAPYLPRFGRLVREVPWVYSNVLRVAE